jgi:hypothetical protein
VKKDRSVLCTLGFLVVVSLLWTAVQYGASQSQAAEEKNALFKWFDGLGFPDLTNANYVEVATGDWHQSGDKPPENRFIRAFLLKDDSTTFEVFTYDLKIVRFAKTDAKVRAHERVGYEPRDLKNDAEAFVKLLKKPDTEASSWPWFNDLVGFVVMARACAAQGHPDDAKKLLGLAEKRYRKDGEDRAKSLQQQIAEDVGLSLLWRAVVDCGDPNVSRKELLARFENVVKCYPQKEEKSDEKDRPEAKEHARQAREYLALLKHMVAEDEKHAKRQKPEKPTKREQIAELIFQLREQNGHQFLQPGWCDIFDDFGGGAMRNKRTPAHQLVEFGYDAVPQLIDVLEDRRLTRSVGFGRNFYFSHHVLRVGDCSHAILERITGRDFRAGTSFDEKSADARKAAQAWWKDFQKKGEKQMLIEGTQLGGWTGVSQARMLAERYPDVALDAIGAALKKEKEGSSRVSLVQVAATIKGDKAVEFLRREVKDGVDLRARVAAAAGLLEKGHDDGIPYIIEAWEKLPADRESRCVDLIRFLAKSNRLDAMNALGKNLRKRPIDVRLEVIGNLSWEENDPQRPRVDVVNAARDRILVEALHDVERRYGESGSRNGKSYSNPRVCDIAGHVLSEAWGQPLAFDLSGTLPTRNRQRLDLENIWRGKQGLKPLPAPETRPSKSLSESEFKPVLQAVLETRTPAERREAIAALERQGLPAFAPLRDWLDRKGADHPARAELQQALARLAFSVDEIVFGEKSVTPDKALRARIDALKGKPLDAKAVSALLVAVTESLPEGVDGIEIRIEREGDDTGVKISITLVPTKAKRDKKPTWWSYSESVCVKRTLGCSGSMAWDVGRTEGGWREFESQLAKALLAPPDQTVSALVRVVAD